MKHSFLATAVLAAAFSAQAAPELIDFDAFGAGTLITNQYSAQGVIFAGASISDYTCCGTPTPALVNATSGGSDLSGRTASLTMTFASAVSALSLDYDNYGGATGAEMLAYDSSSTLLETVALNPTGIDGFGLSSYGFTASGISSVQIRTVGFPSAGWLFAVDNLRFDAAAVPEPTSVALVSLALLGLGLSRRRAA